MPNQLILIFKRLFLPEFQKRMGFNCLFDENDEKSEFYNVYYIYKHYYC